MRSERGCHAVNGSTECLHPLPHEKGEGRGRSTRGIERVPFSSAVQSVFYVHRIAFLAWGDRRIPRRPFVKTPDARRLFHAQYGL
jgi:hypothetical protein